MSVLGEAPGREIPGGKLPRPASAIMFDWMHIYLISGGLLQQEIGLCFRGLRGGGAGAVYAALLAFLLQWVWPHAAKGKLNLDRIFSPKAARLYLETGSFSCDASQMQTWRRFWPSSSAALRRAPARRRLSLCSLASMSWSCFAQ